MQANKTVTINGRLYDAVTGLPVKTSAAKTTEKPVSPAAVKKHAAQIAASYTHSLKNLELSTDVRLKSRAVLSQKPLPRLQKPQLLLTNQQPVS
jgi:hypothetical protein